MQDNDTSRRRKFYDQMSEAYDLGSFEEFDAKMNNPESRKKLHDFIDQDGKYDIGDFEYFDNAMKPVETPKQQTTEQPAQTSAAPQQQVSTNGMQPAATNTPQTAAPVVEQKPAEPEYTQPYDAKGNVLTNNGQPYSQEALRRYYSPENKAPNYRDLSRIAADLEQEQSVSRMQTTGGAGFVPDRPMNAYEQQDAMMQKIAEQNKKASWRDEELNVGTDGSEEPKRSTKGEVYDQLYKQFDEAFKNGKMGDRSAYSIAREAAEKMGIKDDEQMTRTNQLLSNVNRQYAKAQAKNTVSAIMEKMPERSADPLQALQSLYYDRDLQNQIMQTAAKMGNDYDQYVNMFIKPQLIEAMKQKYGGTDNDWTSVKGLFSNWQHVTDRLESNDIGRMLGDYFAPAVDAAFKQADERANAVAQQYNESQSPYTDQGLDFGQIGAMRKANEARDPKQILADLENSLSGPITEILQNQQMTDEIFRRAEQRGMSVTDYIDQFVAPQLTDALRTQFEKTAVAREMPVNDFDYIMRGLNDSVVVMLIDRLTRTESQQYYRNLADAAAAEDRSVWTEGARLATGMASDFWLWAGWGKLGAKATGELMAKRVAERAAADHITISAARRLIEEEGKQFLDKGIVEGMMRHIPQSAVTMAGAEATSEAVRGIRDREEVAAIIGNTLGAAAGGGFTGTLFGVTGGVMGRLTSQLAGPARLAGKLAGFGVEASTMYTAEELQKMANGEDVFQNPYDGMIESIIKLGFIKASANPLATGVKLYEAVRHPVKSVKAAMTPDSPTLTEDEVRDIQDSQDGAALMEALVKMRPARSTDKEEREGYISEADAEIAAEAYREFMSNPNRPYITKQKVAHLLGGALPPAGLEVKADIIDTDNGALLQTRNVLGELIDQTRYDSREAAEKAAKDMATDLYNNETVALEEQVTKKDLFLRVKEKIDKEYQAIAEKFGDTSDQDITSRLTERERNILYLHQHLDELMDVYQKISDGQDLDVDGEKLASTFMQFFDRFMKDRGPVMDFRRKFEAGNNLMLGEIDKILEKEEARTESDEQILSAYKEAMRKHVWKEALEDLSNKPDLTDTTYEESPVEDVTSTETGGSEAEINGSSQSAEASSETISGASETPSDTQARREAAYDRGMAVVQDNSTLPAIGHDTRLAEARLMQQLPDSNPQLAKIRNQILAAIDNGEVDNVDLLIDDAVKNNLLNQQQLEAIEAYRDVAETQQGIQDAIAEQTKDFGDVVRMEMEDVASPDGTIREITLKDGSKVFYKSGDLDNQWGGVYATDLSGNARQVRVSEIVNISEPISVDDFVTNSINEYAAGLQEIYDGKASGQILDPGQQVDMIVSGQPVSATVTGDDMAGNIIFQLEDGSQMPMSQADVQQAIMEADNMKIQQQLKAEADAVQAQQRTDRFTKGIKGYTEGQPDLTAKETDAAVAAEYLKSQFGADGSDPEKARKQYVSDVQNTKEQLKQRLSEANNEIRRLEQWLAGNEDIATPEEVTQTRQHIEQLRDAVADIEQRQQKYGELNRQLMTSDELASFEQQRRRDIFKARNGYQPQLPQRNLTTNEDRITMEDGKPNFGLTSVGNANNYLLRNYEQSLDAESFINEQRTLLRQKQRDEVQPEINQRNATLEKYMQGLIELTPDEVSRLVHEVADLEAYQDALSDEAVRLREIAEGIPSLYERNGREEQLTPAEMRGKELDKATDRESKRKIAQKVYADNSMALDIINDQEPKTVEEFISQNLPFGKLNWEGFDRGERHIAGVQEAVFGKRGATRGIGKQYSTNAFNQFLAPEGEGMGFDEMVHYLYEDAPEVDGRKLYDDTQIRDALMNMLLTAQKPSDISHLLINNRIADAEAHIQEEERLDREAEEEAKYQELQEWADAHHLTPEEVETYQDYLSEKPWEFDEEIINQIIADDESVERSKTLDSQHPDRAAGSNGEGGESQVQVSGTTEGTAENTPVKGQQGAENGAGSSPLPDNNVSGAASAAEQHLKQIQDGVEEHLKKYNTLAPVEILSVNSDDDMRKLAGDEYESAREYLKEYKVPSLYDSRSKKIYTFAENIDPEDVEQAIFHESIHRGLEQYYGDGLREVAEAFWETESPTNPEKSREGKQKTAEAYKDQPEAIKEEYLTLLLGLHMTKGTVDKILARLNSEHQEVVGNILNNIGYDREQETAQRQTSVEKVDEESADRGASATGEQRQGERLGETGERGEDSHDQESEAGGGVDNSFPARLAKAKAETDTNPTEAQKQAGNYKMGHLKFGGYDYSIENPKGSTRSGVDKNGKPWSIEMKDTYGYILRKIGVDGDHLDMFINDDADLDNYNGRVYIVDQKNDDGTFDEHKVMYGYLNWSAARKAYERNYEPGWWDKHVMHMTGVKKEDFDKWLTDSDHKTKPFAEYFRTRMNNNLVIDPVTQVLADINDRNDVSKQRKDALVKERDELIKQRNKLYSQGLRLGFIDKATIKENVDKVNKRLKEVLKELGETDTGTKPTWDEKQLAKYDDAGLQQLRKKAEKDLSTSKNLLATTSIDADSEKGIKLQANINQAETDIFTLDAEIQKRNELKKQMIEDMEAGGAMIDHLENIGVDVTDNVSEMRNARKQAEKDNSKEGKIRKMTTSDGKVYGFAYRGKLYMDPRKLNANLPLHEYSHLWCEAFRRLNPEGWNEVVGVMKQDADTWQFVKSMNPELTSDDDIAEEVIAKGSGDNGEERIRQEFERMSQRDPSYKGKWANIWKNISKAIQDFWKKMGDFLHIKYESPKQVYDQVLKDFASGVNPRKKVEQYLKQRDQEYLDAVNAGDKAKATKIFNDALMENVGNGMTPYVAVDSYRKMQQTARKVKKGDPAAIEKAARLMAPLIPENAVLIPVPSHEGKATDMLELAHAIADITGSNVADILTSKPRQSQFETKKQGGKAIQSADLGITMSGTLPKDKIPVVIDNVVDSGNTAEACIKAIGTGIVASLADSADKSTHAVTLKSAQPVVTDKDGNVIPLSKRFDLSGSRYLGKKLDSVDELLGEVERRQDEAKQRDIEMAVESLEGEDMTPAQKKAHKKATKAVLRVMQDAGVPVTQVTQEEADQMMELYVMTHKAAEIMPHINAWHGSGSVFTKFDHSHMGEGAGSQTFGYGTYLSNSRTIGTDYANLTYNGWTYNGKFRQEIPVGKSFTEDAIRDILVNLDLGDHFKKAVAKPISFIDSVIRDYEENYKDLSEADLEDLKEWKATKDFLEKLKPEDFVDSKKNLYKVEIPDDNGKNYLDYMRTIEKPLRRRIADAVRGLEGQPKQSVRYDNYKNGWQSLADMIERNQWAYEEIRDRLLHAFGGKLADEKKISDLMQSAGFVGVKYPAGTIFGGGNGAINYVIFNEDNAKIVDHIQFMFDEGEEYKPVFYSNAMKAVQDIKQDKATPEQWLKMIEKAGGIKAGEEKWLQLGDWLKTADVKSLTKQQIMDYINTFQIQVADKHYREYFNVDTNPTMIKLRGEYEDIVSDLNQKADALQKEIDAFSDEMYKKYGQGWVDKLDEEEKKRDEGLAERYRSLNDIPYAAYDKMVERYGNDFEMAFEYHRGTRRLEPTTDMYGDGISDAAKEYLNFDADPINNVRIDYTTQGLDNKKEIALVVPTIEPYGENDQIHFGDAGGGRAIAWIRFGDAYIDNGRKWGKVDAEWDQFMREMAKKYGKERNDTLGLLTSMTKEEQETMNKLDKAITEKEKQGMKRVLVIDEIQSKRHQQGREKGYKSDVYTAEVKEKEEKLRSDHQNLVAKRDKLVDRDLKRRDEIRESKEGQACIGEDGYVKKEKVEEYQALFDNDKELNDLYLQIQAVNRNILVVEQAMREMNGWSVDLVPDAPFEKNWHELAMKRMLRYAAENGYDKIAWTTGDQQAERYDIGGIVPYIDVQSYPDDEDFYKDLHFSANGNGCRVACDSNGKITLAEGLGDGVEGKSLGEVFGKDVAIKIMEARDGARINLQDMRVGGEGMKGFYDEILPRFINKYGKKWGVKVGEINLPDLEKSAQKMWSIDVTPEMKESVMQGQPMFQKEQQGRIYGWTDGSGIFLTPLGMNPNSPMHEYTHIWDKYIQKHDPKLWKEMVATFKKTAMWQQVYENPNYRSIRDDDDRMASEVHARLTGARSEEEFAKAAASADGKDTESIIRQVKDVLRRFWEKLASLFGYGKDRLEEFVLMPLRDVLNGFNPIMGDYSFDPMPMINEMSEHAKQVFNAAKERFGTTNDIREAGYVLPDGAMLDFSGRHLMNPGSDTSFLRGRRSTDHRDISDINYEKDGNTKSGIETSMPDFIRSGAIRIDDNAGNINLSVKPTYKQKQVLRLLIARNEGYVQVDFGDGWDSDHYVEYDEAKPQRVLADIDRYFDEGIKPQGNMVGEPSVRSLSEGNLFSDADFEPEQKKAKSAKKRELTDEELLKAIGKEEGEVRRENIEIYDLRHQKEREEQTDVYTNILYRDNTELEDAYAMYNNVFAEFKNGGYASPERTNLLAQIDALEDYIELKELEKSEQEMEESEQEELEQEREERLAESKAEAKQKYEQQQDEVRQIGYDLTQIKLRPLEKDETCHVERRYQENGFFSFTGRDKVESIDDVAYIFKELEDAAVENTFVVFVKDNVPTIVHMCIGTYARADVDFGLALNAYQEINPDKVYFVHNHPSGNLNCSKADRDCMQIARKLYGAKLQEGIIIDTKSGKYGLFDENDHRTQINMPEAPEQETPLKVYSFSKQVFDEDWNPETAFDAGTALRVAKFVSSHRLGEHDKMSLIVMSWNYKVTGNVFLPYTRLSEVMTDKGLDLVSRYMHQMGGKIVVLYGNYQMDPKEKKNVGYFKRALEDRGVYLMDIVHIDKKDLFDNGSMSEYYSYHEKGVMEPDGTSSALSVGEPVTDKKELERLDSEPKEVGYRNVVLNEDGSLGSPMANRLGKKGTGRKATSMFEFGKWERSDENPDLATEDGKIDLIKPDGKSVGNVDYNPYIHIRPTLVNKQFKQAWERPNLVYVRTEYPASELTSGYHADKAKLSVGKHPWNGGELILSRYDKPMEIVPWEEVADDWVKEFEGTDGIYFDIIPPKLLPILVERGVNILPPHKGMGKACNDAYEAFKESMKPKAMTIEMQPKFQKMPEQQIEDLYHEGLLPGEALNMQNRVLNMSPKELVEQYERLNSQMLDENGLNIDEQEDAFRQKWADEHGWPPTQGSGFGQASADHFNKQVEKYTYNKMALRWDILDRIKELGLEAYIDPHLKAYMNPKDLDDMSKTMFVRLHRQIMPEILSVNNKFNKELNNLSDKSILELGNPSANLLAAGIENKPMRLMGTKLLAKIRKHGYEAKDVRNLPLATHNPIAIFKGSQPESFAILTELNINGKNVLVTLSSGEGDEVDFNIISSAYPKDGYKVINWINQNKGLYYDKEKTLDYLRHSAPIAETTVPRVSENISAAKVVKEFVNPKLSEEKLRNIYAKYVYAAEETADMLGGVKVTFESESSEEGTLGWYDPNDNTVHVVLPEHTSVGEVQRTVFHEKLGHEGLVALLGDQNEVIKFGQFVYDSASKGLRKRIVAKADEEGYDWTDHERFSKAAQEVIAEIAENGPRTADEFSLWRKIKHYFINILKKLGIRVRGLLNDHDLEYYILKTGEALKQWNNLPPDGQKAAARQSTDFDIMRSRRGKPRKRNNESMAQYLQRLREWEMWKIAEEKARENNDPMPEAEQINEKWHEKFNRDMDEWRRNNNIPDTEQGLGEFPKRRQNESPQQYAMRVADYETQADAWRDAPNLFDYLQRANDEYRQAYADWKMRYGIHEAENVDLGLYEGNPDRLPHIVDPEDLEADMRAEADLVEAVGIDMSSDGARRHAKLSIVERRKNLESANAEDAIWIHDLVKKLNEEAERQGVTGKELREALPDIIEGTYFEDVLKDEEGNVIKIVDISDQLPIKLTTELREILSDIKDWYDYFFHEIEDAGLRNDAGYIEEGYINHVWSKEKSDPKAWEKYVENFQRTKSPNMRERLFDTYRDGRDVGLVQKYTDIADIIAHYSVSNNEAIANKKFLDSLSFIVVEELNGDGEVVSVLPLLNSKKPNIAVSERYKMYQVPGVGDVYVLKDIQRTFANVFGTMRTQDIPDWLSKVGKVYDVTSSTAKKIELSFSAFHMGALTEVAMAQMRPDRAMKALAQYIIFDCAKAGTIPAYAHPEDFKFAASHLVQLGATQDYAAADVNAVTEKIREFVRDLANSEEVVKKGAGFAATPLAAALDYINKGMDKVLWNYLHDGLKIACFKMFAEQIDKRVEKEGLSAQKREELLDEAGQYVNDTFGGQYFELLNVSPALLKWLRRGFLSPDWLISTQRHFLANFGFGSVYSESGFLNYLRYNRDNIKRVFGADIPRDENRRFRSKNAKQCYLLGVCGFFYVMMNAINAMFRAWDEDKEREKAEEERRINPDYRSGYELAYPDGMKWYDYTMYGNTLGQQTHLFLGRYNDGTEWYARWGKQFREFPELFMGRHGVEFPTPLMERMSGKANPIGRYLMYDLPLTVGMYGYKQPRETQEIAEKYGNTVALLAMTAKKFVPYSVPTQQDKEFKVFDLVMPSQKGFTRWKAVDFFKTYVQAADMDGIERTYNACVMNGIDAEDCLKAAISTVKATQRKEMQDGIVDLQTAMQRYDEAKTSAEKKMLKRRIHQYLAEQNYKSFSRDEALEQVGAFLNGGQPTDNDINKYVELSTSEDVRDDYRMSMIKKQAKKFVDEVKTSDGERQKKLRDTYNAWFKIDAIIKDASSNINKLKKQLGKGKDDADIMNKIRTIRTDAQRKTDAVKAP